MLKVVLASWVFFFSIVAHAASISHNGYTLDRTTDIVTGKGLRWLGWEQTRGKSIDQALEQNAGWRLATNDEVATLFNSFDLLGPFTAAEEESVHYSGTRFEGEHFEILELFGRVLGYGSAILYGDDKNGDGLYKGALIWNAYDMYNGENSVQVVADYLSSGECVEVTVRGVTLCANSVALVQVVPVPAAVWLFGSALLGLVGFKRYAGKSGRFSSVLVQR